ncbi:MAG: hypothetical protein RLZZ69_2653, partial [Cyanobacteriota bacterium]
MLTLTYEFKLEPTTEQIAYIENTLNVCRSVWNFALGQRKDWCASRKSPVNACSLKREYIMSVDEPFPNYHFSAKQLTEAKKNNEFLSSANAQVLQQTLRTLDRETPRIIKGVLKDGLENTANPTPNNVVTTPFFNSNFYRLGSTSEDFIEKNIHWVRLRDISLSYRLPEKFIKKQRVFKGASVFLTGTDLFIITNYS